ncbi:MAG: dihydrofolate reductase [Candidatus Woesearchaeota archaeon]
MLALIVAIGPNGVIGNNNKLPWDIPEDLKLFKETTKNNSIIMGMKTFESIGKPLPYRNNIVLTSKKISIPGVIICNNIEDAIKKAKEFGKDIFCIGGTSIYKQFIPLVDKLYISWIKKEYEGDIYFPELNLKDWEIEYQKSYDDFNFIIYTRKND